MWQSIASGVKSWILLPSCTRLGAGGVDATEMKLHVSALLLASGLIASPAYAAEPFDGRWAPDVSACASEGGPASLLVVTSLSLRWRDAACAIRSSYRVRDAWHIGARCWAEAATSNVPIKLEMRGDRLVLDWAGAPAEELRRCP
jgi:hypothetical protein